MVKLIVEMNVKDVGHGLCVECTMHLDKEAQQNDHEHGLAVAVGEHVNDYFEHMVDRVPGAACIYAGPANPGKRN